MIYAYILIKMTNGHSIKYVRNAVTDSGKARQYYAYTGNGSHTVLFNAKNSLTKINGLEKNQAYSFRLALNGGAAQEYFITLFDKPTTDFSPATYNLEDVLGLLQGVANNAGTFRVDFDDDRRNIVFKSTAKADNAAVVVSQGTTAPSLFSSIAEFVDFGTPIVCNNYFNQTDAGKVKSDYDALVADSIDMTNLLLEFPDVAPTTTLVVPNDEDSLNDDTSLFISLRKSEIAEIIVVEQALTGVIT